MRLKELEEWSNQQADIIILRRRLKHAWESYHILAEMHQRCNARGQGACQGCEELSLMEDEDALS